MMKNKMVELSWKEALLISAGHVTCRRKETLVVLREPGRVSKDAGFVVFSVIFFKSILTNKNYCILCF